MANVAEAMQRCNADRMNEPASKERPGGLGGLPPGVQGNNVVLRFAS